MIPDKIYTMLLRAAEAQDVEQLSTKNPRALQSTWVLWQDSELQIALPSVSVNGYTWWKGGHLWRQYMIVCVHGWTLARVVAVL